MKINSEIPMEILASVNARPVTSAGQAGVTQPSFSASLADQNQRLTREVTGFPADEILQTLQGNIQALPDGGNLLPLPASEQPVDNPAESSTAAEMSVLPVGRLGEILVATPNAVLQFQDPLVTIGLPGGPETPLVTELHLNSATGKNKSNTALVSDVELISSLVPHSERTPDRVADRTLNIARTNLFQTGNPMDPSAMVEAALAFVRPSGAFARALQPISATSVPAAGAVMVSVNTGAQDSIRSTVTDGVFAGVEELRHSPLSGSETPNPVRVVRSLLPANTDPVLANTGAGPLASTAELNGSSGPRAISDLGAAVISSAAMPSSNELNNVQKSIPVMNTPLGDSGWESELGSRVRWLVGQNRQVAELRLSPPSLGVLEIRIVTEQEQVKVTFYAQNSSTRELMETLLPRLRESLSSVGIELGETEISDQSLSDRSNGRDPVSSREDSLQEETPVQAAQDVSKPLVRLTTGLVDTFI